MNANLLPSQQAAVVGVISPDAHTAAAHSSGWIDMSKFSAIQAIIMTGTLGASATVDAKLQQATNASGAGAKDVTGKAITQLVKASNDDDQAVINCRAEELDVNNGFTHVKLVLTVGTAASDAGAVIMGHNPAHGPASDYDLASVQEIIE